MTDWLGPAGLFRNAVAGGLLVAVLCSVLGVYVVLRRLVLLGVALPQAGAAGIAVAFWLSGHAHASGEPHASALVGSLGATFAALALLVASRRGGSSPPDWGVGALFAITSAATVLFVAMNPTGDLEMTNLLRGELLAISDGDLAVLAVASAVALLLFALFRREILLASFDPEFARTLGRDPGRADALLFALIGIAIALGVMNAGPLVVFGFLVLPALAALRIAPGLGAAFGLAATIGAVSSAGGFFLAYHADLPAGPTSVAVATACWLLASGGARLGARRRRAAGAMLALLALGLAAGSSGCGARGGPIPYEARAPAAPAPPLSRGSLPDLSARGAIVVAPLRNDTGQTLRLQNANALKELGRAAGDPFAEPGPTVPDALQAIAVQELAKRGIAVRSVEESRALWKTPPASAASAARAARDAGLSGPILLGTLRRFTFAESGLLLVWLDLELVDPADGATLWRGSARRPQAVRGALTSHEIVLDAGPGLFADAFGASG